MTAWYRAGTFAGTNGNATITGTLTAWLAQARVGDIFRDVATGSVFEILTINSDTSITLATNYTGTTGSGKAYEIIPTAPSRNLVASLALQLSDLTEAVRRGFEMTSITSTLIGTGSRTFSVQPGVPILPGASVKISSRAGIPTNTNCMFGTVTSYTGSTLVVQVTAIVGSGTFADWNINITGNTGATGDAGSPGPAGSGGAPNLIVNGDFQINQRSFAGGALAAGAYGHDRWGARTGGANYTVAGYVVTLASGEIGQVVEPSLWGLASFASQPVTISVEAPSAAITVRWGNATGTIAAGSGRQSVTLTSSAGGNATLGLARSAGSVTFGRVRVELGSTATDWFARPALEETFLAYRYKFRRNRVGVYDNAWMMAAYSTTQCWGALYDFPAVMRASPTMTLSDPTHFECYNNAARAVTAISGLSASPFACRISGAVTTTGLAIGQAVMFYFKNTEAGWIDADAELAIS